MKTRFMHGLAIGLISLLGVTATHAALTGPFHEAHQKEMFFSKSPIIPGQEDPDQMTIEFDAEDPIYGIIYFDGGVADWGAEDKALIDPYVNGQLGDYLIGIDMRPLKLKNLSYLTLEIVPEPSTALYQQADQWAKRVFSQFKPGDNEVRLNMYGIGGSFTVSDWESDDLKRVEANAAKAIQMAKGNAAKDVDLPEDFTTHTKNPFEVADLSEKAINGYFMRGYDDEAKRLMKIAYPDTHEEWYVVRDDFDLPLRQQTWNMGFLYQGHDDACYFVYVPFIKEHLGGGRYGKPKVFHQGEGTLGHVKIDCAKT